MSACISSFGEYSEHEYYQSEYVCERCGFEDTAKMLARITELEARSAAPMASDWMGQANLESLRALLDNALAALDERAARKPDAYTVLAKVADQSEPTGYRYCAAGQIWPERGPVEAHLTICHNQAIADPRWFEGMEYVVVEIREARA